MSEPIAQKLTRATFLWNLVFSLTLIVYAVGLFIPIMEPDAAVYAQVSMEMHDRGDYFSIYHKGVDWLDKPHFPFWMSALSFEIFGVNTFAYKLPAVIFVLVGAIYTYLFAKRYYSAMHGFLAAMILMTAEHIIISNQDVRAEPFMTGLMIMGLFHLTRLLPMSKGINRYVWQTTRARRGNELNIRKGSAVLDLTLGGLACACLIMTKGLFTIIPIGAGIGLALIYQKQWKEIFHYRWLLLVVITAVFLTPAIYGYYQQFDKHPEKLVFGEHNVSGVEFFLWTSQWGRFTNTGPIKGKGDLSFFVHTMLWAFLPWAFAAFFALFKKVKELIQKRSSGENYTFFGFITLFLIFSVSRFQLSFYLNPIFPLLSILTVAMLLEATRKTWKTFSVIHLVLSSLLIIAVPGLHYLFSGSMLHWDTVMIMTLGVGMALYIFTRSGMYLKKAIFATALVVVSINYYVNREFYPQLLTYQAESEAAKFIKVSKIPASEVVFADEMQSIADVILHAPTKVIPVDSINAKNVAGKYVFTTEEGKRRIDSVGLNYVILREFADFPVTRLTGKFINRSTRKQEIKMKYLLKTGMLDMGKPRVDISFR